MQNFAAYCLRGLESSLQSELEFHGFKVLTSYAGCVIFEVKGLELIPYLNHHIRIAEAIDLLLFWRQLSAPSLDEIECLLAEIDYTWVFPPEQSFAIRARRYGSHDFGSMDLMQVAARAVTQSMERQGHTIHANLKQPQVYFRAYLQDENFSFGLNTSGDPLSKRYDLEFSHEAPLNRTIAAALIWDSSFRQHGRLLDPMCGGGTILIEAGLWREDRTLELGKRSYAFLQHCYHQDLPVPTASYQIPKPLRTMGGERSDRKVAGAELNLKSLELDKTVRVLKGDARKLGYLGEEPVPLVVTNPPYGIRVMKPRDVDLLYQDFAKAMAQHEVREIVAITPKKRSWLDSFAQAGYHLISTKEIFYGDMPAFIIKHHIEAPGL